MADTKVAINGFGRIGRSAFKVAFEEDGLDIVAINDLTDTKTLAHLLKHDSNYGTYQRKVDADSNHLVVDGTTIQVLNEKDPAELPWKEHNVDVVIESTGIFRTSEQASAHLDAGAKKVVVSAPMKDEGGDTFVLGVNDKQVNDSPDISSNASCTTNCITPVAAVMLREFGIENAMMTTIHSYTASQNLQDGPHKDLNRARAAAENIVPTTTGATNAAGKALPELTGIFEGMAIRVPTPVGSLSDFTFVTEQDTTVEEVNQAMIEASEEEAFKGILDVTDEPLVSRDFIGDSHSAIVDLNWTQVCGSNMVKVVAWYDNEWGYSNRLIELVKRIGETL